MIEGQIRCILVLSRDIRPQYHNAIRLSFSIWEFLLNLDRTIVTQKAGTISQYMVPSIYTDSHFYILK